MARSFGIIGTKGGTTKTSTVANLGGLIADLGHKVLAIDGDGQQSLSAYFQIAERAPHGLLHFITKANPEGCISKTNIKNFDVILNDDPDNKLRNWFQQAGSHFEYLKFGLAQVDKLYEYDYILIDTKGESDGPFQESVIRAVDELIAPITPEFMAAKEFSRGTLRMLSRLRGPDNIELFKLPPLNVVISRLKSNVATSRSIVTQLRKIAFQQEGTKVRILDTVIYDKEAYNVACGKRLPVHRIEPNRPKRNSPTPSALELQLSLVRELLPHLEDEWPSWEGMPAIEAQTA
ncbi:ParA family protein [Hahella ganghwensis]|uniref:ParA family protein n=1 Tax=Hahella ganghwensis TaxID=286420 RepID=UPI00036C830D|nr:ParA family protein [Hahella ganghwensis]